MADLLANGENTLLSLIVAQVSDVTRNSTVFNALTETTYSPDTNDTGTFTTNFDIGIANGTSVTNRPSLTHDIDTDGFRGQIVARGFVCGDTTSSSSSVKNSSFFNVDLKGCDMALSNTFGFVSAAAYIRGKGTVKLDDVNIAFTATEGANPSGFGTNRFVNNQEVVYDWKDVTFTTPATRSDNQATLQIQGILATSSFNNVKFDGAMSVEFGQGVPQYNTVWGTASVSNAATVNNGGSSANGYGTFYSVRVGRPQGNSNTHAANRNRWTVMANNDFSGIAVGQDDDADTLSGIVARGRNAGGDFLAGRLYKLIIVNGIYPAGGIPLIFSLGSLEADQEQFWTGNTVQYIHSIADADTDLLYNVAGPANSQIISWTLDDTRVDLADNTPVYPDFVQNSIKPAGGFFLRGQSISMPVLGNNQVNYVDGQDLVDLTMADYSVMISGYKYLINEGYAFTFSDDDVSNLGLDADGAPEYTNTNPLTVEVDNRLTTTLQDTKPLVSADITTTSDMYATIKVLFQNSQTAWVETANTEGLTVDLTGFSIIVDAANDSSISGTDITLKIPAGGISGATPDTPGDDYVHTTTFVVDAVTGDLVTTNAALVATGNTNIVGIPEGVSYALYDTITSNVPNTNFGSAAQSIPTSTTLAAGTRFIVAGGGAFRTFGRAITVPDSGVVTVTLSDEMVAETNYTEDYQDGISVADFTHEITNRTGTDDTSYIQLATEGFSVATSSSSAKYVADEVMSDILFLNFIMGNYEERADVNGTLVDRAITFNSTGRYQVQLDNGFAMVVFTPRVIAGPEDYFAVNPVGQYDETEDNRANILLDMTVDAVITGDTETTSFILAAARIADADINLAILTINASVGGLIATSEAVVTDAVTATETTVTDAITTSTSDIRGTNTSSDLTAIQRKVGGLYGLV